MKKILENKPKISVVIPTRNRPQFIGTAVNDVLNQTYQNFEVIILDSSLDDKTEKIIKGFNDSKIKYIRVATEKNLPSKRNQGVKESSKDSEYIAFLDDDNELLPRFLEKSIRKLEENKDLIGVIPKSQHVFDDGIKIRISPEVGEFWNT